MVNDSLMNGSRSFESFRKHGPKGAETKQGRNDGPTARERQLEAELHQTRQAIRQRQVELPVVGPVDERSLAVGVGVASLGLLALGGGLGSDGSVMSGSSDGSNSGDMDPSAYDSWQSFSSAGMDKGYSLTELGRMWS